MKPDLKSILAKFEKIERLGGGTFGSAWKMKVLDEKLKRAWGEEYVVFKTPNDEEKEKFLIEEIFTNKSLKQTMKKMQDPNVVKFLDFVKYETQWVMVTEFVDGYSLDKVMHKKLEPDQALEIIKQICSGLKAIHNAQIIHRDIKPSNIMICHRTNTVKICDLGISRVISQTELSRTRIGTPLYMSPEVLNGKGGSFYSDVYATGLILYEMLTQEYPFGNPPDDYEELIKMVCRVEHKWPDIDDDRLSKVIMKAINHDTTKRYQTAADLLVAIDDYENRTDIIKEVESTVNEIETLFNSAKYRAADKLIDEAFRNYSGVETLYERMSAFYSTHQMIPKLQELCTRAIAIFPSSPVFFWKLGVSYYEIDKETSKKYLTMAVEKGLAGKERTAAAQMISKIERAARPQTTGKKNTQPPPDTVKFDKNGMLTKKIQDIRELHKDNPGEIESELIRLRGNFPDFAETYVQLGRFYHDRGRYEDAAAILCDGINNCGEKAALLKPLAIVYHDMNKNAMACEILKRAINIVPDKKESALLNNLLGRWSK